MKIHHNNTQATFHLYKLHLKPLQEKKSYPTFSVMGRLSSHCFVPFPTNNTKQGHTLQEQY